MADKKKPTTAEAIVGDNIKKLGTYEENTGGGTPLAKGEKLKDHPEAHRVMQPRDENGQFTYNSANRKPLKYGPSRGTTIPPFLTGINMTFAIKKGDTSIVFDNAIWKSELNITANEFFNSFKQYDTSIEGGFKILQEGKMSKKKGAKSKFEKAVLESGEKGVIYTKGEDSVEYPPKLLSMFKDYISKAKNKKINPSIFSVTPKDKKDNKTEDKNLKNKPQTDNSVNNETNNAISNNQSKTVETQDFSDEDIKNATGSDSDKKAFIAKHKEDLLKVVDAAKNAGVNTENKKVLNNFLKQVLNVVASGKAKNFDFIIKDLKGE